jgi:GrpB-like predicted nucleotidyltransferase (UPF0157 family)
VSPQTSFYLSPPQATSHENREGRNFPERNLEMTDPVIIVDYNPMWPTLYEEERAQILHAIGEYIGDIQHVGSTSVPGLGAKPIIDIMIGIHNLSLVEKCVQPFQNLGYEYRGEFGIPNRHYFRKPPDTLSTHRTHHIHMVETNHDGWRKTLLFRDYLRTHPEDAKQYEELKRTLADKFGSDREGYTDAKTDFIETILAKAASEE